MRLLIYLAVEPGRVATIREIAGSYGISRNHLMKVANQAVQAGHVEAVRGRAGGLRLAKPAHRIRVGDVLRGTEDWSLAECFDPASNTCSITGGCGLRSVLKEALEAYLGVLDGYTLADLVRKRKLLVQILGLKTA